MTKTVVSITCLGTMNHRSTHPSVLTTMHQEIERYAAKEGSHVAAWLIDGPGSVGTPEHPTPGTYIYAQGKKQIASKEVISQQLNNFNSFLDNRYRAITGEGVESSLLEASLYIEDIIKKNNGILPTQINLQGFSRGADTCVRIANILHRMHPSIKVNLFLIDPVPGPGRRDDPDSYTIPPNVNDCKVVLMLNEHRTFFQPQHRRRYRFTNPKTHVSFQHLVGRHGAGIATRP
ncbi:MAG TPA: hypothetical protein VHD33_04175, partial [Legionellaceae bacterium]|nr:hypothetical protein [Legionellaceae bacterium]